MKPEHSYNATDELPLQRRAHQLADRGEGGCDSDIGELGDATDELIARIDAAYQPV
jgi:hypothetical protein